MPADNFAQVTIFDFARMEVRALVNKVRVIGHEGEKVLDGVQRVSTTIDGVLQVMSDSSELYYDFPPPGHFHIERGH